MAEAAIHSLDSQAYHDQALFRHLFGEIEGRQRDDIRGKLEPMSLGSYTYDWQRVMKISSI